jgi:hypothetical protein
MTKDYSSKDDYNGNPYDAFKDFLGWTELDEGWSYEKLFQKYEHLRTVTLIHLPGIWAGLEFALSVKSILNIKDCTLPFPGIILGPASVD